MPEVRILRKYVDDPKQKELETYVAQTVLVALAVGAGIAMRLQRTPPAPPGPAGGKIAGSREGVKL